MSLTALVITENPFCPQSQSSSSLLFISLCQYMGEMREGRFLFSPFSLLPLLPGSTRTVVVHYGTEALGIMGDIVILRSPATCCSSQENYCSHVPLVFVLWQRATQSITNREGRGKPPLSTLPQSPFDRKQREVGQIFEGLTRKAFVAGEG